MKLISPLPLAACRAALREQVGRRTWRRRFSIFHTHTSHVVGDIGETEVDLEAAADLFSQRLVGRMHASPNGTVLEATWRDRFGSRLWGDAVFDETEVLRFLAEYGGFKREGH